MTPPVLGPDTPYEPIPADALERSLPARFAEVVRRHGDRLAVRTPAASITYAALDALADRVAHGLRDARGDRVEPIAVVLPKGILQVAAMLGVLKAGKIAAPLDRAIPPDRLRSLLTHAGIAAVLGDAETARAAPDGLPAGAVALDAEALGAGGAGGAPLPAIAADAPVYLLHTSGSTGRPKAVLHTHRTLMHQILRITDRYHLAAADRLTWLAELATGQGMVNAFMALLNGGALYPWDIRRQGLGDLAGWMCAERITVYRSSTSVFRYFVDALAGADNFPALRLLTFASEPAYGHDVQRFRQRFARSCLLVNALSATETGTVATHVVDPGAPPPEGLVPVGRPVDGVEVLLLDPGGAPVPAGQSGEIAVRSRFLAAGYWNEPALTRAAFAADPRGDGARTFRTGDLGQLLPDGALVHLGRRDFQVKVRGFRVELPEVEQALREHPAVSAAVVVARPDARGETALTAYVVPAARPGPGAAELGRFLRGRLPGSMVPSAIVELDALPLTGAGKIDRGALPAPVAPPPASVGPRTPLEERVAAIWADVLGLPAVGVEDGFLDLGGNSLLAARVVNRVLQELHSDVPAAALLAAHTVASMAIAITAHLARRLPPHLLATLAPDAGGDPPEAGPDRRT